jgi:hypothetical protein
MNTLSDEPLLASSDRSEIEKEASDSVSPLPPPTEEA